MGMKTVKITPISQRAKNRVKEHGEVFEVLGADEKTELDKLDKIVVRSLGDTFKYREGMVGKWVGTITREEAGWEEAI
jgi:hypothetical protein